MGLLLVMVGINAMAQDEPTRRTPNPVDTVELLADENGALSLLIKGALPDGCNIETQTETTRVGTAWFIDLFRDVPEGAICPAVMRFYEVTVDGAALSELDESDQLISHIIINGRIYGIERAAISDVPGSSSDGPPPMLSEMWVRGDLPVDRINITIAETGERVITLYGTQTDQCAIPVYRAVTNPADEEAVQIEAYSVISIAASCLNEPVPFELVLSAPAFTTLSLNGIAIPYDPAMSVATQEYQIQPMLVESASAVFNEVGDIEITVSGTTDGCEFPIQIVPQPPTENSYLVKVVRTLPAEMMCTMIARQFTETITFTPTGPVDVPVTLFIGDETITLER
jgi:hypothetical protein